MARNIEIKAQVREVDAIRSRARSLAGNTSQILEQTDTFFVVPGGRLKVREFPDGTGELISYRRPDHGGPRKSVYTRYHCQNARALSETLGGVLPVRGTVLKRREVFMVGRTRIHLDQVHDLGAFVELEVVLSDGESAEDGKHVANELLRKLEIPETDLLAQAYIDLLEAAAFG
jgi:predicted adenylyl cyclase CyaB